MDFSPSGLLFLPRLWHLHSKFWLIPPFYAIQYFTSFLGLKLLIFQELRFLKDIVNELSEEMLATCKFGLLSLSQSQESNLRQVSSSQACYH